MEPAVSRARALLLLSGGILLLTLALWLMRGPSAPRTPAGTRTAAAVPVVTRLVEMADFPVRRRTIGTFESPATVIIRSRIDSQVIEQHITDGQIVKKGDPLFTLDDRELRATLARDQATIARDQAALTQAEAALRRTQELISKQVAPQQQLEQATATYKAAQQTVEAGEAVLQADQLRLGYAKLESPIDGRIGAIRVAPGNLVSSSDTAGLVTVTQMHPLRVSFTLPERDLTLLRAAGARKPPAAVRAYFAGDEGRPATGVLDFVDSSVDTSSGTIVAKATFENSDFRLWPGQYVDVEIDLAVMPNMATVPTVAIQSGQQGPYLFVAKTEGTVEMRKIEIAGSDGALTAVRSGLAQGDRIVVQGQLRLTNGARWQEAEPAPGTPVVGSTAPANPRPAAVKPAP